MIEKGIRIDKIVHRGLGLGYKEGKTYMIYYALPGELVDAEIIMTKKSYSIGRAVGIVDPSSYRIRPQCEYYTICGGCQYMHSSYEFEIEAKVSVLKELLARAIKRDFEIKKIGSRPDLNYRLRAQFIVRDGKLGFKRFNSNDFIKIERCHICHKKINETIERLNRSISTLEVSRLFIATDGKEASIYPLSDIRNNLEISINGFNYFIMPQTFFQANIYLLDTFQNIVTSRESGIKAIELYAGSGFFSLPLSRKFELMLSVEEDTGSVKLLKRNIEANKIENITILNSSVENASIPEVYRNPDLIILNPPRSGMSKKAINRTLNLNPSRIIYVSCDPATLSRDVYYFYKNFYDIEEITLLDQFPRTFHFETIVKMKRIG